jgi:peptide chain release factor 2
LLETYNASKKDLENLKDIYSLAKEESNKEITSDCLTKIEEINEKIKKNQISCFLSRENDTLDIYLEIHAGAGGTESQDWAEMLRKMYLKRFDKRSFN